MYFIYSNESCILYKLFKVLDDVICPVVIHEFL